MVDNYKWRKCTSHIVASELKVVLAWHSAYSTKVFPVTRNDIEHRAVDNSDASIRDWMRAVSMPHHN